MLRAQNSKAYSDWKERKIQHKDKLTWPAHINHVFVMVPVYWLWHAPAKIMLGGNFGVLTGMQNIYQLQKATGKN